MSIGRRLIDLARAELNSLLDRAARAQDDDDYGTSTEHMSDKELEEELERRRQAREEADRATRGPRGGEARRDPTGTTSTGRAAAGSGPGAEGRRRPEFRRSTAGEDSAAVRRAYDALEVPHGSSFETVRRAYRTMMRKYHPDLHTSTPEREKDANAIAQKLTDAYKVLEKKLRR